jgi:hypothetical protein
MKNDLCSVSCNESNENTLVKVGTNVNSICLHYFGDELIRRNNGKWSEAVL